MTNDNEQAQPITELPEMKYPRPSGHWEYEEPSRYYKIGETVMMASLIVNVFLFIYIRDHTHRCISQGTFGAVTAWECSGMSATPITGFSFKNMKTYEKKSLKRRK